MENNEATLNIGEPHPMAHFAYRYVKDNFSPHYIEAIASTALEGNRCAEICLSTYERLERGDPVSDRYIMGLALLLISMQFESLEI